MELIPF